MTALQHPIATSNTFIPGLATDPHLQAAFSSQQLAGWCLIWLGFIHSSWSDCQNMFLASQQRQPNHHWSSTVIFSLHTLLLDLWKLRNKHHFFSISASSSEDHPLQHFAEDLHCQQQLIHPSSPIINQAPDFYADPLSVMLSWLDTL